jgi:hypothetical protein
MVQKVYGLIKDNGDGGSSTIWLRDKAIVDRLLSDDDIIEEFYANEGCSSQELTFPDDLDLSSVGFRFRDDVYRSKLED